MNLQSDYIAMMKIYITNELKKHCVNALSTIQLCQAKTKDNKQCTNKASCCDNTLCKKHKNYVVQKRNTPSCVIYHNHLPNEIAYDCPRCLLSRGEANICRLVGQNT